MTKKTSLKKTIGVISILLFIAPPLQAEKSGLAIGVELGTLGVGLGAHYKVLDWLVLRGGFNNLDLNQNFKNDDLDYDAQLEMKNIRAGVDIYPFNGSFRLSAAYVSYDLSMEITAKPRNGTLEVNGEAYDTTTELESLNGDISSVTGAPYIGFGWGNPVKTGKGFGFMLDLGAVLLSEVNTDLYATCPENSLTCHSVQSDVDIEEAKLQRDINNSDLLLPVINLSLSYQI